MKILKNENGYIVSVTAIVISVILGLSVLFISNSTTSSAASSTNNYSSSQARWAAVSGIEHALIELYNGIDGIPGTYNFYNGQFTVDTTMLDPVLSKIQITSTGTSVNSTRIFTFNVEPTPPDSALEEGFEDDEGFDYSPTGAGPGEDRFWSFSCAGYLPNGAEPVYVLQNADSCYFFGSKVQNNSNLIFEPVALEGNQDYVFTISLAAGVDDANESKQDKFQTGDFLEIDINGVIIERWEGEAAGGGNPLCPTLGNSPQCLTPNFEDYTFNITEIVGELDTVRFNIEGKTNKATKFIGIEGISLIGLGGWNVLDGSYTEL